MRCSDMTEFLSIPNELLENIFQFLNASDLVSVCETCCRFRSVVLGHDRIWQKLCFKDYGVHITSLDGWSLSSYRDFYTQVLCRCGSLLGLWKTDVQFYGGLVHIHIKNGRILADQCCPPIINRVNNPLRIKPLFEMTCTQSGQLESKCLTRVHPSHDGSITVLKESQTQLEQFSFFCDHQVETDELSKEESIESRRREVQQWIKEEFNDEHFLLTNPHLVYGVSKKYSVIKEALQNPLNFSRVTLLSSNMCDGCVISPGIYKGTYSTHGIELILVTDCKDNVLGTKITGDPNVPAGEMSFNVDLSDKLQEEGTEVNAGHSKYPLHLPADYHYREVMNPPNYYTARFKGYGQIARHGFVSPEKSPLQMYVISNTEMGLLWTDLRCFSMFVRTNEDFLQPSTSS